MLLFGSVVASAADWPLARGNASGNAVAEGQLADRLAVKWKLKAENDAGFETTAVISSGMVYLGDTDGIFYAVDLLTGKPVWKQTFEESGFGAGAAVKEDRIVVGDFYGVIRCLSTDDGKELWKFETDSEVYAPPNFYEDNVLVCTELGALYALDLETGKEVWRYAIEAPLRCQPTLVAGHVMLAGCDSKLHTVEVTTGKKQGECEIDSPTGSTAAARDAFAYFGVESGNFYAINASDPAKPAVAWTYRDKRRGQGIRAAAAVSDEMVVYGSQGKSLYGLNRATGELAWQLPVRSGFEAGPVIVDQRVVAATEGGKLLVVDLEEGEIVWDYEAGGGFQASPVVVDGLVLIGNEDGTFYCFGPKDPNS